MCETSYYQLNKWYNDLVKWGIWTEISAVPDFATDRPAAPGAQKIMEALKEPPLRFKMDLNQRPPD